MRPIHALFLAALVMAGCERSSPVQVEVDQRQAMPPAPAAVAVPAPVPVPARPARSNLPEGASSCAAVFARASKAFAEKDYETVYQCVDPKLRESWLRAMVLSGMFSTMGHALATGGAPGSADALAVAMNRRGAALTLEQRMGGLDLEQMQDALLAKVDDRAGLFADFVSWAGENGSASDPMKALSNSGVVQIPIDPAKGLVGSISDGIAAPGAVAVNGPAELPTLFGNLTAGGQLTGVKVSGATAVGTIGKKGPRQRCSMEQGLWFLEAG
jgi:hypothetical protein